MRRNDFTEAEGFERGKFISRISSTGLNDSFRYDSNGFLNLVERAGGATWEIDRNGTKTAARRNNVVQMEFVSNPQGQLVEMWY